MTSNLLFTDPLGQLQTINIHGQTMLEKATDGNGIPFDASSIALFRSINNSDLVLKVSPMQNKYCQERLCYIYDQAKNTRYDRDPRSIAFRTEEYVRGLSLTVHDNMSPLTGFEIKMGLEPEFFIFDSASHCATTNSAGYEFNLANGNWNSWMPNNKYTMVKPAWYTPAYPFDEAVDIRRNIVSKLDHYYRIVVDKDHHEVATGQSELGLPTAGLVESSDNVVLLKYTTRNVAYEAGKIATFLPKPLKGENGSGMHIHQSLWHNDIPLFFDPDGVHGLSPLALNYIGGIQKHFRALCAFCNPTTNSYRRLRPGFEAPTTNTWSFANRSTAIRVPGYDTQTPGAKRIEFRVPDPSANPYLATSACVLAGIDGVINKLEPNEPVSHNVYEDSVSAHEQVPSSLSEALVALEMDHEFLTVNNIFPKDFIEDYIAHKRKEIDYVETTPHPAEIGLYLGI